MSQNQLPPNYHHPQNNGNPYSMGQQVSCGQNYFGQPMQQDPFAFNHQQQNPCPCIPIPSNSTPCPCPSQSGQTQTISCNNLLPQNIIEQIRTCVGNTTPIFILPGNNNPSQFSQTPGTQVPMNQGFPSSIGYSNPSTSNCIFPPPCYPYPFVLPVYEPFSNQNRQRFEGSTLNSCNCCGMRNGGNCSSPVMRGGNGPTDESEQSHRCSPGSDDTICTKANCPSSINLQALASQFLSLQGVIPCAATRLLLKKVPGSNVTTSIDETMERAQKSIGSMNKDQLIAESRNAQQVNGLINLHMVAKPPGNIVPVLTMLQLKVNSLKALVENLVNKKITECHSVGAEANCTLEPMLLMTKSDGELRELLGTLRQRECEERVNLNYAAYHSQRVVAESRLGNIQSKIRQVETEMDRRRNAAMPWVDNSAGKFTGDGYCRDNFNQGIQSNAIHGFNQTFNGSPQPNDAAALTGFESPSPFMVQVRNPKKLNLKANVGCPRTICEDGRNNASPEAFAVSKLEEEEREKEKSKGEDTDDDTRESRLKVEDDLKGKKKLRIRVDTTGDLSVSKRSIEKLETGESLELSPADVVIVIDKSRDSETDKNGASEKSSKTKTKTKKTKGGKNRRNKSPSSVKSDSSTYSSEVSMASSVEQEEESEEENDRDDRSSSEKESQKSKLIKNILKLDKKQNKTKSTRDDEEKKKEKKSEKHVNVAMITELRYDDIHSKEKFKNHKSGSILFSNEQLPMSDLEDCSQSSIVEGNNYHDDEYDDDDDRDDRRSTINVNKKKSKRQ